MVCYICRESRFEGHRRIFACQVLRDFVLESRMWEGVVELKGGLIDSVRDNDNINVGIYVDYLSESKQEMKIETRGKRECVQECLYVCAYACM